MRNTGKTNKGKQRFICRPCHVTVVSYCSAQWRRRRRVKADELLSLAARALPANLPAEIKEEAQQAIIVDLLTEKVKAAELQDSRLVKRYVREAYGFQNGYKFTSLDAPVSDGATTLGELIAA